MPADTENPYGTFAPGKMAGIILWLSRNTVLGRARHMLGTAFGRFHPWPVDTVIFGLPARLYPFDNAADFTVLFESSRFSPRELKFLRRILAPASAVFVDIGANAGLFALFAAAHAGPEAIIVAVEPHPVLFKRLVYNLSELLVSQSHGPYRGSEIQLLEVAVGAKTGTATLRDAGTDLDAAYIVEDGEPGHQVRIKPLHQVLWDIGIHSVDVLKIDIEGYEDKVLESFYRFAPASLWPRAVIIGHLWRDHWAYECIALCEAHGYTVLFKTRNNTILLRDKPRVRIQT